MADKPHITAEGYVAKLVRVGFWATPQNPIQYAFLEQKPFYLPNEQGWAAFSAAQRAAVQRAFVVISEVVNLTFVQVADNQQQPGQGNPRINFYANSVDLAYSGSMNAYQFGGSDAIHGADIRFNTARIAQRQANEGFTDFTSFVALHEVLHGVGLSHPGEYNGQGYNYQDHAEFVEDTIQYSVMSYFGAVQAGADHTLGSVQYVALTPLLYDILALQSLYAPNMTTRAGDTVYGFNSNTGANSPFNFAVTTGPVVAIWDAGGIDTIDLSGYSSASLINLNAGEFSDADGLTKNIAIAFGVTIENAVGGAGDDVIHGNQAANHLAGGAGNDILDGREGADLLDGGIGADQMDGGAGDDIYVVDSASDQIFDSGGIDTLRTAIDLPLLNAAVENLELLGSAAINGVGNAQSNMITGNDSANILDGREGDDRMIGRGGDDIYAVDSIGDIVVEQAGGGNDELRTGLAAYMLAANVEKLTGLSAAGQWLTGNDLANLITGMSGNDVLDGGAGIDTLRGGAGDDLYLVGDAGDAVVELVGEGSDEVRTGLGSYLLTDNVETLTGTSNGGQSLTGNASANLIVAGTGNDLLDGGGGADVLRGGLGNDVYTVDDAGDGVTELFGEGTDEIRTSLASYALDANIENLTGISGSGQVLTGNDGINLILGGAGNDLIDGGLGADDLRGALGNDVYLIDSSDTITELSGEGTDEIRTGLASYALGANLEQLTGTSASGQSLTGNGGANVLTGADGNDLLDGGLGNDHLAGGAGNDVLKVSGPGLESVVGGADIDTLVVDWSDAVTAITGGFPASGSGTIGDGLGRRVDYGEIELIVITTGSGDDTIGGSAAADIVNLGAGNDIYLNLGATGNDLVDGGAGEDGIQYVDASIPPLVWNLQTGSFSGASGSFVNFEYFTILYLGFGNDLIVTSALDLDDNIYLNGGDDSVTVLNGHDTLNGASGNDLLIVDYGAATATVTMTAPAAGSQAGYSGSIGDGGTRRADFDNFERFSITAGSGNDSIVTASGDDYLDGGLGADSMTGGAGNDTYLVDSLGDLITELAGEGIDEIRTWLSSYSLAGLVNVENLIATTDNVHDFRGNAGNNLISGAGGNDFIRLQDGGIDTANGGGGNDVFLFGATLTSADSVDGGIGLDQVAIQGDYSGGLTLGAAFASIESFAILPGSDTRFGDPGTNFYSYNLTTINSNVAPGVLMIIDANRLRVGEDFTFNGSAETDGNFFLYGGGGTDTLLGGSNNDTFYFGENGQFGATDHVDGGISGTDQLGLRGSYTITFGANQLTSIESIGLVSAQDTRFGALGTSYNYNLTMNDGNVAAGVRMTVDAAPLRGTETLTFDGSAEIDGSFRIFGGRGADTIKGSQGSDLITGSLGADSLRGGGGNDMFNYRTVDESTSAARDAILDFTNGDLINLSPIDAIAGSPANDAFTFVGSAAFSNTAGELRAVFDSGSNVWTVQGDINGDGIADLQISVVSDHPIVATDFIL